MAAYMPRLGLEVPRKAFLLLLVLNLAGFSAALYEDQAGKFDWRQQYVGRVATARWEGQTGPARRLLLATNHHLVAALNPRNGHLLWRQQLPNQEGPLNFFLHQGSATVTVSGRLARAWDLALGVLAWETLLPPGRVQGALLLGNDPHHLVVLQMKTVTLLTLTGGHISWSVTLPDSVAWEAMLSAQAKSLYVIGRSADGYVTSLSLELDDGSSVDKTMTTAPAGLSSLVKECAPYEATSLVCLPHTSSLPNHLYLIPLSSSSNLLSSNVSLASLGLVPELSSAGAVLWGVSEAWERFGGRAWGSKSLILRLGPKAFVLLGFNNGNVTVLKEFEQTDLVQLVAVGPGLSTVVTLTQKNSTAYSTSLISGESGLRFVDSAMTFNVETALKTVDKVRKPEHTKAPLDGQCPSVWWPCTYLLPHFT
uniref:EMC1 first beta-propeller domain-containing protein n=1 Tax=Eptatretus burgeri TaxID=7764 RepID=A0A8C4QK75_EPTBU